MTNFENIEKRIKIIEERNRKVSLDKSWETSWTRIIFITAITYIVTGLVFWAIGIQKAFFNAFIPTIGFFLSVQSLSFVKKYWIKIIKKL